MSCNVAVEDFFCCELRIDRRIGRVGVIRSVWVASALSVADRSSARMSRERGENRRVLHRAELFADDVGDATADQCGCGGPVMQTSAPRRQRRWRRRRFQRSCRCFRDVRSRACRFLSFHVKQIFRSRPDDAATAADLADRRRCAAASHRRWRSWRSCRSAARADTRVRAGRFFRRPNAAVALRGL